MLFSRMVKYCANGLRPLFVLHLFLRPNKRYRIPGSAPPLIGARGERRIPRIIWQTNYTNHVTLAMYVTFLCNRMMAPTFEYRYHGDEEQERFIRENFSPEIVEAFSRLKVGAARADFWRVLVLLKYGGVYIDMDANLVWSPERFIAPDNGEFFIADRSSQVTNYFLASAPDNPVFFRLADTLRKNIESGTQKSVFNMTGPVAIERVLTNEDVLIHSFRNICHHGQFTNPRLQNPDNDKKKWWQEEQQKSIVHQTRQ